MPRCRLSPRRQGPRRACHDMSWSSCAGPVSCCRLGHETTVTDGLQLFRRASRAFRLRRGPFLSIAIRSSSASGPACAGSPFPRARQSAGRIFPVRTFEVLRAGAKRKEAASGCRFLLSHLVMNFPESSHVRGINSQCSRKSSRSPGCAGEPSCAPAGQAAMEIAPASLSTMTGDSKYSISGSAPRRSRMPARQASS